MIEDISFIVIARNEEFAINKCLQSISELPLENCEIICVDSNSTDATLQIMKSYKTRFKNYRIFQISGNVNASIARNAGIKHATKKYIFFVDGDIELNQKFVIEAYEKLEKKYSDGYIGWLSEIMYSDNYERIIKKKYIRCILKGEKIKRSTGGILILSKEVIDNTGLWNENFFIMEDIEYSLRCSRKYKIMTLPIEMGTHHTKLYQKRLMYQIKKSYPMLMGNIFKANIDNWPNIKELLRKNRGPLTGLAFYVFLIFNSIIYLLIGTTFFIFAFPLLILMADMYVFFKKKQVFVNYFIENYISSLYILLGFCIKLSFNLRYKVIEVENI